MADLVVITNVLGSFGTNSYIVYNTEGRDAVLIDPPSNADFILNMIGQQRFRLQAILLTHGHIDHMGAVKQIREALPEVKVYAAEEEAEVLRDSAKNLSAVFGSAVSLEADVYLRDGETISFMGREIQCSLVPGHTQGGMCYYIPKEHILFSGDTLFAGSVGRSDFPTGSASTLIRSIEEKLFVLPGNTKVYPGHGETTTIEEEQKTNPFF